MPIKRVIAFRFDRNPLTCRARVRLLRALNPGVPVHGIFGGAGGRRGVAFGLCSKRLLGLDSVYISRRKGEWNWKMSDLVLVDWFREMGRHLPFDVLHLVEWDLLLTDQLDRLYASVPPEAVGLTAYTPTSVIGDDWRWFARPDEARQWRELLAYARTHLAYDGAPHGCIGPGPCFPRSFLSDYAQIDPPALAHDELRIPLFAQTLRYPVVDTGFRRRWHAPEEDRFFNASAQLVDPVTVVAEMAKPDGRRAFHPVHAPMHHLLRMCGPRHDRTMNR